RGLVEDWQGALEGNPAVARQLLKKLLVGPIKVTPLEQRGSFRYEAEGTFSRLLRGIIGGPDPGTLTQVGEGQFPASYQQALRGELKALAASIRAARAQAEPVSVEPVILAEALDPEPLAVGQADGSRGPTS